MVILPTVCLTDILKIGHTYFVLASHFNFKIKIIYFPVRIFYEAAGVWVKLICQQIHKCTFWCLTAIFDGMSN